MSAESPSSPRRFRLRWSRADSVATQTILALGMVLVGLTFLASLLWITPLLPAEGLGRFAQITVHQPMGAPATVPDVEPVVDDVTIAEEPKMTLRFEDPSTLQRLMLVLSTLLTQAAALTILYLILRVLRSLDQGDPFVPANVRRIYTIALTMILAAILVPTADGFAGLFLQHGVVPEDGMVLVSFTLSLESGPLVALLAGLLLAALAEVFRRGARMRDDVEGLV